MKHARWVISYYQTLSAPKKTVLWFMVASVAERGISIVTTPLFTRILSTEQFGVLTVFNSWSSIIYIFVSLNLHVSVLNNALMKSGKPREHVVSAFQGLSITMGLLWLAICLIFRKSLSIMMDIPEGLTVLMFVSFIFMSPYYFWRLNKRYEYDYKRMSVATLVQLVVTPSLMVLCVILAPDAYKGEARVVGNIISVCLFGIIFIWLNFSSDRTFIDGALWKYALWFNLPLIPHFLSEIILNQSDRIMINHFEGTAEAGVYSIANSVASLIQLFFSSINAAFIPYQYNQLKEKKYDEMASPIYVISAIAVGMCVLFSSFAPEIIYMLAGKAYMGAVGLVPILSASIFLNYIFQNFVRIELYYDKRMYTVFATVFGTVINIVLNLIFIPNYGYIAAGYTTLICQLIMFIMHWFFYKKVEKDTAQGNEIFKGKFFIVLIFVELSVSFIMMLLYDHIVIRLVVFFSVIIMALVNMKTIKASINEFIRKGN